MESDFSSATDISLEAVLRWDFFEQLSARTTAEASPRTYPPPDWEHGFGDSGPDPDSEGQDWDTEDWQKDTEAVDTDTADIWINGQLSDESAEDDSEHASLSDDSEEDEDAGLSDESEEDEDPQAHEPNLCSALGETHAPSTQLEQTARGTHTELNQSLYGCRSRSVPLVSKLPLEVLCMVMERVDLQDLFNLSKTCKMFNSILHDVSARSVWKLARLNTLLFKHLRIPIPPSGVAESHWAALLLGRRRCWDCNSPSNAGHIIFTQLRRLCTGCLKKNTRRICSSRSWCIEFPTVPYEVKNLLPLNNSWFTSRVGGTYAVPAQVDTLAKHLRALRVAVDVGEPGALQSLQSFKSHHKARSEALLRIGRAYRRWDTNLLDAKRQISRFKGRVKLHDMSRDLLANGHSAHDIDAVLDRKDSELRKILYKGRDTVFAKLRLLVTDYKAHRLRQELHSRIERRVPRLEGFLKHFVKSQPPCMWLLFPGVDDLSGPAMNACATTMGVDLPAEHDTRVVATAFTGIAQYIAHWPAERWSAFSALVPRFPITATNASPAFLVPVFTCARRGACQKHPFVIGMAEAVAHRHEEKQAWPPVLYPQRWQQPALPILSFSERGTMALAAILHCSRTPSIEGLAKLDARYVCSNCDPVGIETLGAAGRISMKWRPCFEHLMDHIDHWQHREFNCAMLEEDECAKVKAEEPQDPARTQKSWACAHCCLHYDAHVDWWSATTHVLSMHGVVQPVDGVDILWMSRKERPLPSTNQVVWFAKSDNGESTALLEYKQVQVYMV